MSSKPSAIPEPFSGQPTELPIESDVRVRVHTELGVDIYFSPQSRQFTAQMSAVEGRGSSSELRSSDFDHVLARIRERAMIVPVLGYLIALDEQAPEDAELVRTIPCAVIEHHPRRGEPYVIRVTEELPRPSLSLIRRDGIPQTRIRTVDRVYLPEPAQLEALRAATQLLRDEHVRHRAEVDRLGAAQRVALDAVKKVEEDDLVRVQETGRQVARDPSELVFDGLGATPS